MTRTVSKCRLLALICWVASALLHRRATARRGYVPVVLAGIAFVVFLVAAFQRLEPQMALAVEPEQGTVVKLERLIRKQKARTYIAFSEWIALGFPVVNNTGVAWASRFDSMWALKGELWRVRFDAAGAKEWPIRRWVAHDFIVGCPDPSAPLPDAFSAFLKRFGCPILPMGYESAELTKRLTISRIAPMIPGRSE